jgi:hypothetical protein
MELPNNVISMIGEILDISSDFRTSRLINKNWASELGTTLTELDFNFSDTKIDTIKSIDGKYFFNWFINHIKQYYPSVYHINVILTISKKNISEEDFLYFFDLLIKWCMKTKKNKISLSFENVNISFIIYTLKLLSTKLIILNDYNINLIDISITFKDDEIIDEIYSIEINNIYNKINRYCNLKYISLNIYNHNKIFISNFCENINTIYLNIDQNNNELWFIDLINITNCKKIILNVQSFCFILNIHLATEVIINIQYLNHEIFMDLLNKNSRLKYLSIYELPIYNNWFVEFKDKLYEHLLLYPDQVKINLININDIRILNLLDTILPLINIINLSCSTHSDYIAANIINYLFNYNNKIIIHWKNNIEECLDIFTLEDCKRFSKIYKEVDLVWQFVLN